MLYSVILNFLFFSLVLIITRLQQKAFTLEFKRILNQFWGEELAEKDQK
jgi:hypothetical protein